MCCTSWLNICQIWYHPFFETLYKWSFEILNLSWGQWAYSCILFLDPTILTQHKVNYNHTTISWGGCHKPLGLRYNFVFLIRFFLSEWSHGKVFLGPNWCSASRYQILMSGWWAFCIAHDVVLLVCLFLPFCLFSLLFSFISFPVCQLLCSCLSCFSSHSWTNNTS